MKSSSLLVNVSKVTPSDYESRIQSLITNVDLIWLNALALEINSSEMEKKLQSLKEAGLIRTWDYEMSMSNRSARTIDRIITKEEHKQNSEYLNFVMREIVNQKMENHSDYTTFSIEKRNMLSNFLTAKNCGATSIIQRNFKQTYVSSGGKDVFPLYASMLFNQTSTNSVSGLSVDEILKLRKYSRYFRNKIRELIDTHLLSGDIPPSIIRQDCEKLSKEYCEEVNARIRSSLTMIGTSKGVALDIASIWVVPVTLLSIGEKIWDAIFNRNQRGFVMYLTTLQNYSKQE